MQLEKLVFHNILSLHRCTYVRSICAPLLAGLIGTKKGPAQLPDLPLILAHLIHLIHLARLIHLTHLVHMILPIPILC